MTQIKSRASVDKLSVRVSSSDLSAASRTLRGVAIFEAAKGLLVLLGGIGLFELIHHNVQHMAEQIIAHTHLNPANGYPRIFLDLASKITDGKLFVLAFFALAYALIRLAEAYGLWFERRWAQWLGAISGGIYVPIEIYELFHQASTMKFVALVVNLAIVIFLARRLAQQKTAYASI